MGVLMNQRNMSWDDRLRAMEELWQSCGEETRLESPALAQGSATRDRRASRCGRGAADGLGRRETRTAQAR